MRLLLFTRARPSKVDVSNSLRAVLDSPHRVSWGQQCSQTCGCVIRFQAYEGLQTSSPVLTYIAKQIVSVPGERHRRAVLTLKGRPMIKECKCSSLHHLSSALVEYYSNSVNWQRIDSDLEFQAVRSSGAFRQSVLKIQGLPATATHCFDLVEEAWTAMVKGYIPRPRSFLPEETTAEDDTGVACTTTDPKPNAFSFYDDEGDDQQGYQLYSKISLSERLFSAIRMFDSNQQQQEEDSMAMREFEKNERQRMLDWQSYVDQIYDEESQRHRGSEEPA